MNNNHSGDISIGLRFVEGNFQANLNASIQKMQAALGRLTVSSSVFGMGNQSKLMESAFANIGNSVIRSQKATQEYFDNYYRGVEGATKITGMAGNEIQATIDKKFARPFDGAAMSIMFFGMAMQGAMRSVWSSSQKVFQDTMHSVEGTVTSFDKLNSATAYLGFVVGEALAPIAEWLAPIIENIAVWASENEGIVRGLFAVLAVVGSILFLYGMWALAYDGLWVKGAKLLEKLTPLWKGTAEAATSSATYLKNMTGLQQLKFAGIVTGIILAVIWIFKLKDAMGGWGEFVKSLVRGIIRIFVFLGTIISSVFMEAWNAVKAGWNGVVDFLELSINKLIGLLNKILAGFEAASGGRLKLGRVAEVDFSNAKAEVKSFGDSFMDTYNGMLTKYFEWEQAALAPKKGYAEFGGLLPEYASANETAMEAATDTATTPTSEQTNITQYNNITIEGSGMNMEEVMREAERMANISYRRTY